MFNKSFQQAIDPSDVRLKEPHLAVLVIMRSDGPKVPVIGRGKSIKDEAGRTVRTDFWHDLPGGKAEPIYDPAMINAGVPPEKCKIVAVQAGELAAQLETEQEINAYVNVSVKIDSGDHLGRPGLKRHFYDASVDDERKVSKIMNKVPEEHYYMFETDPENAIALLGDRITETVAQRIRDRARELIEKEQLRVIPQYQAG